jgi:glycogen synthase
MAAERAPRVLLTADTVGGVWTYAVDLAGELDDRGVQVAIATMGAPLSSDQREQLAGHAEVTLYESTFRLEWMQGSGEDVAAAGEWLMRLEREFEPDLVHLNQFAFGALPFRAPKLVVAHSCVLSWWRAVHGVPAPAEWDAYRAMVREGLAGADLVAAPTRAMLDTLAANYGIEAAGSVIPNGARAADFKPARKQPFVLAAGRLWDAAKNLAALEQVAPDLPWPVKVAGSVAHPDGGTLAPRGVHCLGPLPRAALASEFAAASIYALPARYEPFGLSVLEAALAGCALVLGDIPSLRENWAGAALFVPPADSYALRRTLLRLTGDVALRAQYAQAARRRARNFTTERSCAATVRAYAQLAPRFASLQVEDPACA